ncbi:MAG: NAD-dependent epimerase/dehydratase family protein [Candidatus Paceibacterota bacterium]|jgi:UDP-glucose 4-epimerase
MVKVIVTGGAGFIGSHIVDMLVLEGYEVHIVDDMSAGKEENINPGAIFHKVDIRDKEGLIPIFKDAKYVFHEAAVPQVEYSIQNPVETNDINVNGLLNVLEVSRVNKVKRVIFASSCAIYGNQEKLPITEDMHPSPLSPYALHKYIGEGYMKLYSEIYGVETVCLRYFNVYGPRQSVDGSYPLVIAKFLDLKKNGKSLMIVGTGENTRDYVNVRDIVRANIFAMESGNVGKGEIINIGTGYQASVNKIAEIIGGEVEHSLPRLEPKSLQADIKKAKELLNWEPSITLEEGIKELKNFNNL